MNLGDFLTRIVDDGIAECRVAYKDKPQKRDGAIAGFEACRGKTIFELRQALYLSQNAADVARAVDRDNYWYLRAFHAQVEWVCNVVSAALQNQHQETIVAPTARGYMKAAEILGVGANMQPRPFKDN